ncbi:type II toxin-antitoxin system YafO family toxin [Microbulbifer sp. 2205BS26-8]|uniref:type II toxin-antitoxin system YafO family toxin n=1 Tax=Microbulbifer sp. 2205BS26-8 TaxID=3064386 RepID=UPI00273ED574|nr:type II toxin-antitoxin system YafO family toxin [Microbulbifer sp. 2205BS26-8]MDP5208538.1 type II toxin-antitoxin system YafO family toxin [Microbulbifer sp. 2205BS26-8]
MHKLLREEYTPKEAKALSDDFKQYKVHGVLPPTFGRDVPYSHTHNRRSLELMHLHYKGRGFKLSLLQFYRTSGYVLVYCPGFTDSNTYLLITIIKHFNPKQPDIVTGTDRDDNLMAKLEAIAEGFREKF